MAPPGASLRTCDAGLWQERERSLPAGREEGALSDSDLLSASVLAQGFAASGAQAAGRGSRASRRVACPAVSQARPGASQAASSRAWAFRLPRCLLAAPRRGIQPLPALSSPRLLSAAGLASRRCAVSFPMVFTVASLSQTVL